MKFEINKENGKALVARLFSFKGRASLKEYWLAVVGMCGVVLVASVLAAVLTFIHDALGVLVILPVIVAVTIAVLATYVRRLHDIGLSGFWMFYLSPTGLAFLYAAYVMDADESAKRSISRIKEVGSPWLSWILALLLWGVGWFFGMCFVVLCPSQKGANQFGAEPNAGN